MLEPDSHYFFAADGEWWYRIGAAGRRTRAHHHSCAHCGTEFLARTATAKYCTRRCSGNANAILRGPESPRWKGGRTIRRGYQMVWMPDHPSLAGTTRKYMAEHRLVMEAELGRPLLPSEYVHHRNGDKLDNRLENLEIVGGSEHAKRHRANHFTGSTDPPHCPTCTCARHK